MLAAIQLDNQLTFEAHEVDNVSAQRLLSAKLVSAQAAMADLTPQAALGIG